MKAIAAAALLALAGPGPPADGGPDGAATAAGGPVAPASLPDGWTDQPAMAAHAVDAAAGAGLTVAVRAWGDASIGVFGLLASTEPRGRVDPGDVIDGFRAGAAAAGIELGPPLVAGPELVTTVGRGRWRGDARLRAVPGDGRGVELAACVFTTRRPERAAADCRAFMASVEAAP